MVEDNMVQANQVMNLNLGSEYKLTRSLFCDVGMVSKLGARNLALQTRLGSFSEISAVKK